MMTYTQCRFIGAWICYAGETMGFFEWFSPKEFMNTPAEWHAFVEGFCETFCFWRANYEPSKELLKDLKGEHHYYAFGRVVGFISVVGLALLVVKILRRK